MTVLFQEVAPVKKADGGKTAGPSSSKQSSQEPEFDPDADDLSVGPPPPSNHAPAADDEPEFDPSDEEDDIPEFPTTHELIMKDHTKGDSK